ncbi:hypothetical protein RFI_19938 [Reticulomyxa filosa]|uniref:RGS domain-containing protein n=1 Tax=Reticulomyxa filosa TaxID=46433 RepID=X6MVC8_RETFI|nr:hypothetical protein RFI_19938 [Reticulomyxa filosa]|eukprot:ETO17382.1 hypothetical protein RFI_19938 [Reticulomyxa filosa]
MNINITNLIISVLCCVFLCVTCVFSMIYYTYHYYNMRHLQPFRRRQPLLFVGVSIAAVLSCLSMQAYLLLHGLNWQKTHPELLHNIFFEWEGPVTLYLLAELFLIRVGMIVFEVKYTMYSFREKWKSYVSVSEEQGDSSFYIRWFPKLRSPAWIALYVFLPTFAAVVFIHTFDYMHNTYIRTCNLIFVCPYVYIYICTYVKKCALFREETKKKKNRGGSLLLQNDVATAFDGVPVGCYICAGLALAWTIPKYKDYFEMHGELVSTLKLALFSVLLYFLLYVVFAKRIGAFVRALLYALSYCCILWLIVMRSTWWIMRQYYSCIESHLSKTNTKILGLFVHPDPTSRLSVVVAVDLSNVLKDPKGFELFMEHLFSELASENLLCYLELTQFRQMVKLKCERNETEINDPLNGIFVLSAQLPQSSIVNNSRWSDEQKAITLIEKYIIVGAQNEVNLSYDVKMSYVKLFQNKNNQTNPFHLMSPSDYIFLFDPVLKEVFRLMRDSYSRFLTTNAYCKYVEHTKPRTP